MTIKISMDRLIELFFFLYICGLVAFNRGYGFDAFFCRMSFVMLVGVEILGLSIKHQWKHFFIKKTICLMLLFVLYYFTSFIWSKNIDDGLYYLNNFIQIVLSILIVTQHIKEKADLENYLKLVLFALTYMAIVLLIRTPSTVWGSERVGEIMAMNSNTVGMYCATAWIICLYFGEKKKLYYFLGGLFVVIAFFSGSRKALIMVLMGFCVFWIVKEQGLKKVLNIVVAIAFILIIFNQIMTNEKFYNVLGYRMEKTIDAFMGEDVQDGSADERAFYREHAIDLFKERPLLGYGANGFVTQLREEGYWHVAYSHCNYTELLVTLGVVGFLLYYSVQIRILIKGIIKYNEQKDLIYLLMLTYIVVNLLMEFYYVSYMSVFQQIMIALSAAYVEKAGKEEKVIGRIEQKTDLKRCI